MAQRKGRSAITVRSACGPADSSKAMAVAAAASVPFSSTTTLAPWIVHGHRLSRCCSSPRRRPSHMGVQLCRLCTPICGRGQPAFCFWKPLDTQGRRLISAMSSTSAAKASYSPINWWANRKSDWSFTDCLVSGSFRIASRRRCPICGTLDIRRTCIGRSWPAIRPSRDRRAAR